MAQVFSQRSGLYIALFALGLVLLTAAAILAWRNWVDPNTVARPVEQPVPFSHKHHVTDDGLDCRYCHTSVEDSAFAGLPPTETCMTCHSQLYTDQRMLQPVVESFAMDEPLQWNRVNDLPDFVYFNHSVHVNNGVGCATCHGRVDRMPLSWKAHTLTMQWCLSCHRDPAPHLRPKMEIFNMSWKPPSDESKRRKLEKSLIRAFAIDTRNLTDCSICHR